MTKAFDNASMLASWLSSAKNGRTIDSTSAASFSIILKNSAGNGDLISLNGTNSVGNSDGVKSLRVNAGNLEILDSTYANIRMRLTDAGVLSAPTITQTSDERTKTNWRALTDAQLDALANMQKSGLFDWLDGSGESVGGSAQEIEAIVPQAVHTDENGMKTVNYGGLCFAIQQAMLRRMWGSK